MKFQKFNNSSKSSPENEMRDFILSFAREHKLDTGHSLPGKPLGFKTLNFNPKQKDDLDKALDNLKNEGVFEEKDGQYLLTSAGRNVLYP